MRPTVLAMMLVSLITSSATAAEGDPPNSWPWPGETPAEIREAWMKKKFARRPTDGELKKIEAAAPTQPIAKPLKPRKILCWGRLWQHMGNAFTQESVTMLGKRSGAFEVVCGDDVQLLLPQSLKEFDAVFLNGLHDPQPFMPLNWKQLPPGELERAKKLDTAVKQSLLDFVAKDGKGIAAIEGSIAALSDWKEYGEMMGAFYNGHYRGKHVYKVEEPGHPIAACLQGKELRLDDQSYLPGPPFSRKNLRVLISLDLSQTADPSTQEKQTWLAEHVKRQEKFTGEKVDWAVSWVKEYGKGRVFYCSLGVDQRTYFEPAFMQYLLAGIQFATGDLPADATPRK